MQIIAFATAGPSQGLKFLGGLVVLGGYNVSPLVITKYMLSIGSGPKMFGALNRQFYVKIFHLHYIKSPIFRVIQDAY